MPKLSSKPKNAHQILQVDPPAESPKLPAPNKAKPPRPLKKQDVADIEQADAEGMAQPQGVPPPPSTQDAPSTLALDRKGGLKGGLERGDTLTTKDGRK